MSNEQPSHTTPPVAHPVHYYADGNLILVVENTKFRLWRSLLSEKSGVMRDMLDIASQDAFATGEAAQEMIDGVPAVTLTDDLNLFTLLLDLLLPQTPRVPTLGESILLFPLLDKYAFETLGEHIKADILRSIPSTFDEFSSDPSLAIYDDLVLAAQIVGSAWQMGASNLLPLAFYALSTKDWSKDPNMATRAIQILPVEDQVRLHSGRIALLDATSKIFKNTDYIQDSPPCRYMFGGEATSCLGIGVPREVLISLLKDPLLESSIQMQTERPRLCSGCRLHLPQMLEQAQRTLFNQLEGIFGLQLAKDF